MTPDRPLICIVEDDVDVSNGLAAILEAQGFVTTHVADGALAVERIRTTRPSLVLLDVQLPHRSGFDICRDLRADAVLRDIPIIMLTGLGDELHRVAGLEFGADDYVAKPFNVREVQLRIQAVLRRSPASTAPVDERLRVGTLELDLGQRRVILDGAEMTLTAKEYELLVALAEARGRALSRDHLLRHVWGYETADLRTRTVDWHVLQLRRKLGAESWRLETVERYGYRLNDTNRPA